MAGAGEQTTDRARVFLGWDAPFLPRVAAWLLERHGPDLGEVVVALPGRRAGRRLEELLLPALDALGRPAGELVPPVILPAGRLVDHLVTLPRPAAGRLLRTLVWTEVLRAADSDQQRKLVVRPPEPGAHAAWRALGGRLRALYGRLGRDDRDFGDVARLVERSERPRWATLVGLQERYLRRLAELGVCDPHDARRRALQELPLRATGEIVLAGIPEIGGLLRRALERVDAEVTPLVHAPEELEALFDDHGAVIPDAWFDRDVPLDEERWIVADRPAEQAEAVVSFLTGLEGRFAPDEITVGVPDETVEPFLERRFASAGVATRPARGIPLARSGPGRLLAALADHLRARRFDSWAALLRHPDLEDVLGGPPHALLDAYHEDHLPDALPAWWRFEGEREERRARRLGGLMRRAHRLLGDVGAEGSRPLAQWATVIADWLVRVYGASADAGDARAPDEVGAPADAAEAEHAADGGTDPSSNAVDAGDGTREPPCTRLGDPDAEDETRRLHAALAEVQRRLQELADLPSDLGAVTAAEALDVLLASLADAATPSAAQPDAIELLGWLELPLDDAPVLVLTGFNEGRVPSTAHADNFLPDALARRLQLTDDDSHRTARDAYAFTALASDGARELAVISGRRSVVNDPLVASRLAFRCPEDRVVARVRRFVPDETAPPSVPPGDTDSAEWALPMGPESRRDVPFSVTEFGRYLRSPYEYYLDRVLGLRTHADLGREMDGRCFGIVAHSVLEAFGRDPKLSAETDPERLAAGLGEILDTLVAARFGDEVLPAVVIQVEQLRRRLQRFARTQASRAADGWRIAHVEWGPAADGQVPLQVDGATISLRGRIDRIDHHPEHGWEILDYKTGEKGLDPRGTHGPGADGWWDLQLPLYRRLAEEVVGDDAVRLGYVLVSSKDGEPFVYGDWTPAELEEADACVRKVVARILSGDFAERGDFPSYDPIKAAVAGLGLLGGAESEGEE